MNDKKIKLIINEFAYVILSLIFAILCFETEAFSQIELHKIIVLLISLHMLFSQTLIVTQLCDKLGGGWVVGVQVLES
jgi:hypothetical protein